MIARKFVQTPICILYFAVLLFLSSYGIHRSHLVYLCWRHRKTLEHNKKITAAATGDDFPFVTIQLPLFNEATVATRLLEAVAQMNYPADRFEVQVLDDSNDETQALVRSTVERLCDDGKNFVYLHRTNRVGYKAGALAAGLKSSRGELIAIFD